MNAIMSISQLRVALTVVTMLAVGVLINAIIDGATRCRHKRDTLTNIIDCNTKYVSEAMQWIGMQSHCNCHGV